MLFPKLPQITTLIFDVDGVLTDGKVLVTESGEQLRAFNIRDGYALQLAVKRGYIVAAFSGGRSKGVESRLKGLGIPHIYLSLENKTEAFKRFIEEHKLDPASILYMGDDIPDVPLLKLVGLAACPADAAEEVKAVCDYISPKSGGLGCARDIIEKVMKVRGHWFDEEPSSFDGSFQEPSGNIDQQ